MTANPKQLRKNAAGFWRGGLWHPIRKPKFVGKNKRQATLFDRQQYDPDRAGDNDDVFERVIRKDRNQQKAIENWRKQEERAIEREMSGGDGKRTAQRLHQFVRKSGGISWDDYDKGELEPFTFKQSRKKGIAHAKGKKSLDQMRESAAEAGYLPMSSDVNDFLDLLEKDMRGRAVYPNRSNPQSRDFQSFFEGTLRVGFKTQNRLKISPQYEQNLQVASEKNLCAIKRENGILYAVKVKDNGRQTATKAVARRKKNPITPGELVEVSIATLDVNNDKKVDQTDANLLKSYKIAPIRVLHKKTGETGELLGANNDGELIINFSNVVRTCEPENITFLNFPEMRNNPAQVIRKNGHFLVKLSNGQFHKDFTGKALKYRTKKAAENLVKQLNLDGDDEIKWLDSLREAQRRLVRQNPLNPITAFATGAGAILNILAIKDRLDKKPKSRRAKRAVKINPAKILAFPAKKKQDKEKVEKSGQKEILQYRIGHYGGILLSTNLNLKGRGITLYDDGKHHAQGLRTYRMTDKAFAPYEKRATYMMQNNPKKNPVSIPRRPNFEMFNGRPATKVSEVKGSDLAPRKQDQLGTLIEIRLTNGDVYRPGNLKRNPYRLALAPNGKRMWILGGILAKPSIELKPGQLEVLGEWETVVYETAKPHIEGNDDFYHYIHPMGEETGERPLICIDNKGYAVIHGGAYEVTERGIVN